MQKKRALSMIVFALVTALLLTGCAPATSDTPPATEATPAQTAPEQTQDAGDAGTEAPVTGDMDLRMGISSSLTTGDPQMTGSVSDQSVLINIFDPLVRRDANGVLQPSLAESWTPVEDTVWEFKLRTDVTFHNGEPFNADAVKFSLDRVYQEGSKSPIQELRSFTNVEVVDDATIRITTEYPDPMVPGKLALFAGMMVPPKYIQENGEEHFNSNPVGTGPFIFKEWMKDSHITMTGNPDYWKEPTRLNTLTIKFMPDAAARVAALLSGDVDVIDQVDSTAAPSVENGPNTRLDVAEGIRIYYLSTAAVEGPTKDVKVRQAIAHAIDYDTLIAKLRGGYGLRIAGPYNTSNFGSDANLQPYAYDVEKAKGLMKEAGYEDGITIEMNTDSEHTPIAEAVAMMLQEIGITCDLKVLPDAEYEDKYSEGQLAPLWFNGYSVWQGDPATLIETFFKSGMPRARYFSDDLDKKIADMQATMDSDARKGKLHEVLGILNADAPWTYLYQANDVYGVSKNVTWDIAYDRMFEMRTATIAK